MWQRRLLFVLSLFICLSVPGLKVSAETVSGDLTFGDLPALSLTYYGNANGTGNAVTTNFREGSQVSKVNWEIWSYGSFGSSDIYLYSLIYRYYYDFRAGNIYSFYFDTPLPDATRSAWCQIFDAQGNVIVNINLLNKGASSRYYEDGTYWYGDFQIPDDKMGVRMGFTITYNTPLPKWSSSSHQVHTYLDMYDITDEINDKLDDVLNGIDNIDDAIKEAAEEAHQDALEQQELLKKQQEVLEKFGDQAHKDAEESKGLLRSIIDGVKNLLNAIIELPETIINLFLDAMKWLFVPEDGYFDRTLSDLQVFMDDHLGILNLPIEILTKLLNLMSTESDTFVLSMPSISIMGYEFMAAKDYDVREVMQAVGDGPLLALRLINDILLAFGFLHYVKVFARKWGVTE